jgi:serine/threonine-protein kinase 24/25/MST4
VRALFWIPKNPPPSLSPDVASPAFCDFVSRCLQKDPADRPSVDELLNHPFLEGEDPGCLLPLLERKRLAESGPAGGEAGAAGTEAATLTRSNARPAPLPNPRLQPHSSDSSHTTLSEAWDYDEGGDDNSVASRATDEGGRGGGAGGRSEMYDGFLLVHTSLPSFTPSPLL